MCLSVVCLWCQSFGGVSPLYLWFGLLRNNHSGKSCPLGFPCVLIAFCLFVISVIFRFGLESWIRILIASVPVHCYLVTFKVLVLRNSIIHQMDFFDVCFCLFVMDCFVCLLLFFVTRLCLNSYFNLWISFRLDNEWFILLYFAYFSCFVICGNFVRQNSQTPLYKLHG